MAPARGRETRSYLRNQGREAVRAVSARANRVSSAVKAGRQHAETAVKNAFDAMERAKAAYHAAKSYRDGNDGDSNRFSTR
jgi:hypothetical protein